MQRKKLGPVLYTKQTDDENIAQIFVDRLQKDIEQVWSSEVKPMIMTSQDKVDLKKATKCWICEKDFLEGDKKVRDRCHYTGRFRGAAHNKCNSLFRKPKFVPVIFHNLSGYDSHLFVKNLNANGGNGNIDCISRERHQFL